MSHAAPEPAPPNRAVARALGVVGAVLLGCAIVAGAVLVWLDPPGTIDLVAVVLLALIFGGALLVPASLARRSAGRAEQLMVGDWPTPVAYRFTAGWIGTGWHLLWLGLAALAAALLVAIPAALDVFAHGATTRAALLLLTGAALGGLTGAILTSLVKKGVLAARARRSGPAPEVSLPWRAVLVIWHVDHALAGIGGALLALALWPAVTGSPPAAAGFAAPGGALLLAALALTLGAPRAGTPAGAIEVGVPDQRIG